MSEERQVVDPTRRMLKLFGFTMTDYEEKTARLVKSAKANPSPNDALRLASEAMALSIEMNKQLRDMTAHVLDAQSRVMGDIQMALERAHTA
jgi:hypothetical protein